MKPARVVAFSAEELGTMCEIIYFRMITMRIRPKYGIKYLILLPVLNEFKRLKLSFRSTRVVRLLFLFLALLCVLLSRQRG